MQEIIIATSNPNKAKEFRSIFDTDKYEIKTLLDLPDVPEIRETGDTFQENATIKAHTVMEKYHLPTIADDSGLEVDELFGQPGVRSARYAGDHNDAANNAKLLSNLGGIPEEKRNARFVTVLVFANPNNPEDLVVEGEVKGRIANFPEGDNGFGYDPLFYVPELGKTMAEVPMEEKNKISHRGNAIRKLKSKWQDWIIW
ncbi:XTP/dITP diphosphatase [Companilactobacillus mishanensis]|uniref:dITP/XTP pyrophosphatase n=1 Tax=Companilactobacillus mishanensis TaxID=2486008 RepID=A0A5P0ZIH3_9LACO|nr:XTP/dITP diphosphatase [Companilactobacillus mishanensis]MQS52891.1 XTP/dITP diphosphatase [Companilactobacillus mishanensis]